jgi:hypothetical protein
MSREELSSITPEISVERFAYLASELIENADNLRKQLIKRQACLPPRSVAELGGRQIDHKEEARALWYVPVVNGWRLKPGITESAPITAEDFEILSVEKLNKDLLGVDIKERSSIAYVCDKINKGVQDYGVPCLLLGVLSATYEDILEAIEEDEKCQWMLGTFENFLKGLNINDIGSLWSKVELPIELAPLGIIVDMILRNLRVQMENKGYINDEEVVATRIYQSTGYAVRDVDYWLAHPDENEEGRPLSELEAINRFLALALDLLEGETGILDTFLKEGGSLSSATLYRLGYKEKKTELSYQYAVDLNVGIIDSFTLTPEAIDKITKGKSLAENDLKKVKISKELLGDEFESYVEIAKEIYSVIVKKYKDMSFSFLKKLLVIYKIAEDIDGGVGELDMVVPEFNGWIRRLKYIEIKSFSDNLN